MFLFDSELLAWLSFDYPMYETCPFIIIIIIIIIIITIIIIVIMIMIIIMIMFVSNVICFQLDKRTPR